MYYFFFSYSRSDNNEYLRTFYADLDRAIKEKTGEAEVSFIDQSGNEPGDVWESSLESALARARVFVAIATANYVKKLYCGKEWAAFQRRIAQYQRGEQLTVIPPLAIPILWIPPDERIAPFPDVIKTRHFHVGSPDSIPNRRGVAYLTRLKGIFPREYQDLIETLADRIMSLGFDHSAFDRYQNVPRLSEVGSPFLVTTSPVDSANTPEPKKNVGPKHVFFVYGAASPDELRETGRQALAAYGDNGGPEWQPFFPQNGSVGAIAPQVAGSDDIGMIPHELPMSADLHERVRACEAKRQLVVILLDSWTVRLPTYQAAFQRLDQQNYINCSVLIPSNPDDSEATFQLADTVRNTLYHRFQSSDHSTDYVFLRPNIRDIPELRQELAKVLIRLRAEIIIRSVPATTTLPAGGALPTTTGPGGSHD
jgi:FxsC-like protein